MAGMTLPLCSVITPTWNRHNLLVNRCIPSVEAQAYPAVEHVIVSDGPDPDLAQWFLRPQEERRHRQWYLELAEHGQDEHWGAAARLHGVRHSSGDLITYCDDDDALRPGHCSLLAAALADNPEAGFAVSRMITHGGPRGTSVTGWGPLACGSVGSPMLMHRREVLDDGTWGPPSATEDWDLVQRWLDAGVAYVSVNAETSDVWPSMFQEAE